MFLSNGFKPHICKQSASNLTGLACGADMVSGSAAKPENQISQFEFISGLQLDFQSIRFSQPHIFPYIISEESRVVLLCLIPLQFDSHTVIQSRIISSYNKTFSMFYPCLFTVHVNYSS